jgi:hypothetical protein
MKKTLVGWTIMTLLAVAPFAQAASVCEVKASLMAARGKTVEMLASTDKAQQETLKAAIAEASATLDAALEAVLTDKGASDDAKAKLTQFKETLTAFKETRENEIIPAILAGDAAKAKELAMGVQADRMKTMNSLIQELGGDECKEEKK